MIKIKYCNIKVDIDILYLYWPVAYNNIDINIKNFDEEHKKYN